MGPGTGLLRSQADIAPGQETEIGGVEGVLDPLQLEAGGSGNQVWRWLWYLCPPTLM